MRKREPFEFASELCWEEAARLSDGAVSDVLVVGDIHGDEHHLANAIDQAADLGAGAVVQVGDFWLGDRHWSRFNHGESAYMHAAHDSPLPIVVIDGNHEIWPPLGRYALGAEARTAFKSRRPLHLGGSMWWAWRGSVRHWAGLRCARRLRVTRPKGPHSAPLALGRRSPRTRRPRTAHHQRRFRLDVLFTHDAPAQVQNLKSGMTGIPWDIQHAADNGRRRLAEAVDRTQPTYVPHGHWHQANQERISECTEVIGLAEDGRRNSNAWLTTQPELHASYAA